MNKIDILQEKIAARLKERPAGIDKLDRLWEAAVLLPIVESPDGPALLFEERAHTLRRQPGEICFPGGKVECADSSHAMTAVRETSEELGLKQEQIKVLGELDALVTHSGPIIHPFVGFISEPERITFNPAEVERVFTVPIKFLLEQEPQRCSMKLADHPGADFPFDLVPQRQRSWRMNKEYAVYFYKYEKYVIWGLTARILYGFLKRSRRVLQELL